MGLLDDPSKLLKPADDRYKWDLPYREIPRDVTGTSPLRNPYLAPMPDYRAPPGYMPGPGPNGVNPGLPGLPGRTPPENLMPAPNAPGGRINPMMPNLPPGIRPDQMMPGPGPQSSTEDPRQTILALFKRFGLT